MACRPEAIKDGWAIDVTGKYFLVEDFDTSFDYRPGRVISLSPQASYQLYRHATPYQKLEDFYNERSLRKNEGSFFQEEVKWVEAFDSFLKNKISYCRNYNVDLAKISFNQFKYFIDSAIIQTRILTEVLRTIEEESQIIYLRKKSSKEGTLKNFSTEEKSALYPQLLPTLGGLSKGIRFALHEFGEDRLSQGSVPLRGNPFKEFLKPFNLFLKYGDILGNRAGERKESGILFVHSGSPYLDPPIRKLRRGGWDVFLRTGKTVYSINPPVLRWKLDEMPNLSEALEIKEDCARAAHALAETLEGKNLLEWVNEKAGADIAPIVLPYLQEYLESACSKILCDCLAYEAFYRKVKIGYVVSHTNSDSSSKSALIAAQAQGIPTVGIQHGCQLFEDETWQITDIDFFDYYFTTDGFSQDCFEKSLPSKNLRPRQLFQSPHHLKEIEAAAKKRHPLKERRIKKVLYVPAKLRVHAKQFNKSSYPATWYYEYQKALFDSFASKFVSYHFVYKRALMNRDYADESIVAHLLDKKFKNVTIDSRSLKECLKSADAVILDRPTTAFFEALASGQPLLALYPDFVEPLILSEAKERFGRCLQSFSGASDALDKIETFLKEGHLKPPLAISLRDEDLNKVLSREAKGAFRQNVLVNP